MASYERNTPPDPELVRLLARALYEDMKAHPDEPPATPPTMPPGKIVTGKLHPKKGNP